MTQTLESYEATKRHLRPVYEDFRRFNEYFPRIQGPWYSVEADSPRDYDRILEDEKQAAKNRQTLQVFPVYKHLRRQEQLIRECRLGTPWPRASSVEHISTGMGGSSTTAKPYNGPLTIDDFPSPYPTVPFSFQTRRLQAFVPIHALPGTITVHDPWNVLALSSSNIYGKSNPRGQQKDWMSVPDKVHTYRLELSEDKSHRVRTLQGPEEVEQREASHLMNSISSFGEKDVFTVRWSDKYGYDAQIRLNGAYISPKVVFIPPSSTRSGTDSREETTVISSIPAPVVVWPWGPRPVDERQDNLDNINCLGEETHLYFSPSQSAGFGHHSKAYAAEWEIPRSTVFPLANPENPKGIKFPKNIFCYECLWEDVERRVREMDEQSEEWKERKGTLKRVFVSLKKDESSAPKPESTSPKDASHQADGAPDYRYDYEYTGPLRPIISPVTFQDFLHRTCTHLAPLTLMKGAIAHKKACKLHTHTIPPPTTKVSVLAKLTHQSWRHHSQCGHDLDEVSPWSCSDHERHLKNEARCYERFPQKMYEHYDIVSGSGDEGEEKKKKKAGKGDIRVGAIVPRFYGFYTHDNECQCGTELEDGEKVAGGSKKAKRDKGYFSDILLMEHCGEEIKDKANLSSKAKDKIQALFDRFHANGWTHGSPAIRNCVVQAGPINRPMSIDHNKGTRDGQMKLSFRLVDFGRSEYHDHYDGEEAELRVRLGKRKWVEACQDDDRILKKCFKRGI